MSRTPENAAGCTVVVFHSVLGLRPGVLRWADRLRDAGHVVHAPDLFDGETFDDYAAGFDKVERIGGFAAVGRRAERATADLPADVVYAGFSLGNLPAERLALTRPLARGVVLMHGAVPIEAFGVEEWPSDLPVQIHLAERDPFRKEDEEEIAAFAGAVRRSGSELETWDYPTDGHLFADPDLPEYDEASAELTFRRVLDFLDRIAAPG